ncbi:hypothetical protein ACIQ7Q_12920 [Streptomyces sp. NPDC096176]|uniref:hypothetical protein n=1 Tax=Streptomyces sp. NPDC096176 TaxID=3366079 RepID=UPI00382A6A1E
MNAVLPVEEEPSYADDPAHGAAGTAGWAKASPHARAAWTVGGAVLIVGAAVSFLGLREWVLELGTGRRYAVGLTLRGALSLALLAGTYCVVRGTWRD